VSRDKELSRSDPVGD